MPESLLSGPTVGLPNVEPTGISTEGECYIEEKPVCGGSGVSCYILSAESTIFITGLGCDGTTGDSHSRAMLRGVLQLHITKSVRIKTIALKFTGTTRTGWSEGEGTSKSLQLEIIFMIY
jgi:hypothetical protein